MTNPQQSRHQALPVPPSESQGAAPNMADDLEKQVARIFGGLLQGEPVGRTDDFFLIGGDSGSAVELQILLSDILGRDFPIKDLFEDTTVSGVAATLRRLSATSKTSAVPSAVLVPLRERGNGPILFLVHGRLGQAMVGPNFLGLLGDDQPAYGLQARGLDGVELPNPTVEAMASDYVAAIRTIQPSGPYFLGGLCAGGYVAMVMANLLRHAGEVVLPLLLIDPPPPPFHFQSALLAAGSPSHDALARSIDQRLDWRQSEGHFKIDVGDSQRKQAAIRTAIAFERALSSFRITPYEGAVQLLASTKRLTSEGWGNDSKRKACFSGALQITEVADGHNDVFDVQNQLFSQQLTACLRQVHALAAIS